jgi:hypothetical protein
VKRIVPILLLWIPLTATADGDSGWISLSGANIQIITDPSSPRVFVYVTVNGGCATTIPVLRMDSSNPVATSMYATLLSAKATGQQVDISTTGCSVSGNPLITSIYAQ